MGLSALSYPAVVMDPHELLEQSRPPPRLIETQISSFFSFLRTPSATLLSPPSSHDLRPPHYPLSIRSYLPLKQLLCLLFSHPSPPDFACESSLPCVLNALRTLEKPITFARWLEPVYFHLTPAACLTLHPLDASSEQDLLPYRGDASPPLLM